MLRVLVSVPALIAAGAWPAAAQLDPATAAAYFAQADTLCRREGGALWGLSLCGPMVIADPVARSIATNRPAPDAPRPRALGFANAALPWGDERWSAFVWQALPADPHARGRMMLHELFHRIQPELGLYLATAAGAPDHLDEPEARYWMQLEWRALAAALRASDADRAKSVRHALAFREARRARFGGAAESERAIEINEGLAQYTGTVAAAASREAAIADAVDQLGRAAETPSFVRTAAYPTGAAYGLLLDAWAPGWTRRIDSTADLGVLLMEASGLEPADDVEAAALRYGGPELLVQEEQREVERQRRIAELRRRFVEGPVLVLPRGRNAAFVTTGVTPLPSAGTIFPQYRVTGEWGSITADQVLVSEDGSTLTVPVTDTLEGRTLAGEGWTLELAPGWIIAPGPRAGDYRVVNGR